MSHMTSHTHRAAWKAGLLSLLLPGLGQLYNGQAYKGLRWYFVLVGTTMLLLAIMLEMPEAVFIDEAIAQVAQLGRINQAGNSTLPKWRRDWIRHI
jgi:TM2 domain-containing membrane protein YozV